MGKELFLIGCGKDKLRTAAAARDLYCSERFQKCALVADRLATEWRVLSAKHGLLTPEQRVAPYDQCLVELPSAELLKWQDRITEELLRDTMPGDRITFLAEDEYAVPLADRLAKSRSVRTPFRGRTRTARMHWLDSVLGRHPRHHHLDQFYGILERMRQGPLGYRTLAAIAQDARLPQRGVYFFFETDEFRLGSPTVHRVVRVGTHGVSDGSSSTLWGRLRTHFGTRQGGGNHRSSVMRLHVGNAMLARYESRFSAPTWGTPDATNLQSEALLEQTVSEYIGRMPVLWIAVPDAPSSQSDRAYIEQNSIALLSGRLGPIDVADSQWLGLSSPHPSIRRSSLWNVNHVDEEYDPGFLEVLSELVDGTLGKRSLPQSSLAPIDWSVRRTDVDQQRLF